MKLDNNIDTIFKKIKEMNGNSSDIATRIIEKNKNRIGYIFLESVSSDDKISNFLNKGIIESDKKKLRRKEAIVAKQKIVLYGKCKNCLRNGDSNEKSKKDHFTHTIFYNGNRIN